MRFRDILLVVVLILAGFVFYQFKTGKWNIDDEWFLFDDAGFVGREVTAEETRTIEGPLPQAIVIENGNGSVEVRGGDQDSAQLTFKKYVWRRNEDEAKEIAGRLKYNLITAADKLTLTTNRDEFPKKNFETSFVLTVPRSMVVTVVNSYGAVRVEGIKETAVRNRNGEVFVSNVDGPCVLETSYDDLEAEGIRGTCRIVNKNGSVRVLAVTGDLSVETSYARLRVEDAGGRADLRGANVDVEARRVAGAVTVDTSYEKVVLDDVGPAKVTGHNMAVTATNVRGDLEIRTSYEPVRAEGVRGRLLIDARNATVTAMAVDGPVISVRTSYENVSLADFTGETSVVCRNGQVRLEPRDLKGAIDVRNENGAIEFVWPSAEQARFEAHSKGGAVKWGLAERPDLNETNGEAVIKAFSAAATAPLVFLSTTYDDIRVETGARRF